MKSNVWSTPALSHRFLATFFIKGVPSPLDMRFSQISGLGREMQLNSIREGGDNLGVVNLAERVTHGTLVLERGLMAVTPMTGMFELALGQFKNIYLNAVILLLNGQGIPVCAWTLTDVMPVRWQTGTLNASENAVLIDTLELAYHEMIWAGGMG